MAKWYKRKITLIILAILLFPVINFYLTPKLPEDINMKIKEFDAEDDVEFIRMIYEDLGSRFNSRPKCWRDFYYKNYLTNGEKIFELQGQCLPCHIQNNLMRAYLLQSGRFRPEQLITKTTVCWEVPMFHVYLEVHLDNGTILNVDKWGQGHGVEFGQTIHDVKVCNK